MSCRLKGLSWTAYKSIYKHINQYSTDVTNNYNINKTHNVKNTYYNFTNEGSDRENFYQTSEMGIFGASLRLMSACSLCVNIYIYIYITIISIMIIIISFIIVVYAYIYIYIYVYTYT